MSKEEISFVDSIRYLVSARIDTNERIMEEYAQDIARGSEHFMFYQGIERWFWAVAKVKIYRELLKLLMSGPDGLQKATSRALAETIRYAQVPSVSASQTSNLYQTARGAVWAEFLELTGAREIAYTE